MNPLLLALPLVLQSSPGHARLHPADTDLYLEIPDARAAFEAYDQAPLVRILRDERLAAALVAMGAVEQGALELDVTALFEQALASSELPEQVRALVRRALQDVRGLSLSIAGLDADWATVAGEAKALAAAAEELARIEEAIAEFGHAHETRSPSSLSELDLADELSADPWGNPYDYRVLADGFGHELRSLGGDGAPGGARAAADLPSSFDVETRSRALLLSPLRAQLVLDFASGETAQTLYSSIAALGATLGSARIDTTASERPRAPELESSAHSIAALPGFEAWLCRRGAQLALGVGALGEVGGDARFARLAAQGVDSLGAAEPFGRASAKLGSASGTPVLVGYKSMPYLRMLAGLANLSDGGSPAEVEQLASLFGGTAAHSELWRTELANGRFVSRTFESGAGEPDGVGRFLGRDTVVLQAAPASAGDGREPVAPESAPAIPGDAMLVYCTSLDGPALWTFLAELAGESAGVDPALWQAELEKTLGFRPERDVFGNLGGSLLVYVKPLSGLALPKVYAFVDLKDAAAFWPAFERFATYIGAQLGSAVSVKTRPYRGVPILSVDLPALESPLPVSPSFAVLDGRLVATLSSTLIKREIKRLQGKGAEPEDEEDGPSGSGVHPLHGEGYGVPTDAHSVYYMDWGAVVGGLYSLVQSFGPMLASQVELPFDLALLPPVEILTGHLTPSFSTTRAVDGGTLTSAISSFGPEMPLAVAAAAAVAAFTASTQREFDVSGTADASATAPVAEPDRSGEATAAALRELRNGLAVYHLENGTYPEALDALIKATATYPRGFLDGPAVPSDGWGRAFRYRRAGAGAFSLWSVGPDGVDQGGDGDDVGFDARPK